MASEVGIANSALRKIQAKTITSFDQGTPEANFINDRYSEVRDELLRSHVWNFAIKRAKLARLVATPTTEFNYYYQLPDDHIRTVEVHDNDNAQGHTPWQEEQDRIAASAEDIYLRYVAQITDPNQMPPDFREAIAWNLAMEGAIGIAQSNTLFQLMEKRFDKQLAKARSIDSLSDRPRPLPRGTWVTSRFRRGSIVPRGSD